MIHCLIEMGSYVVRGGAERFTSIISTAASCMQTNSPNAKV